MRRSATLSATAALTAAGLAAVWFAYFSGRQQDARGAPPVPQPVPAVAAAAQPGRPVIFVGLDGADWTLLDRYIARGLMPTLARLVSEGVSGTLQTLHPPLSPLVWTTMLTGVSPLEHRILDFLRVHPSTQSREPITSDERAVPAVWNMATQAGRRVGAFGFWATYPAEAVNGAMVSDRLFTFLFSETEPPPGMVYPASAEAWARQGLERAQLDVNFDELKRYLPWLERGEYDRSLEIPDPFSHPVSALRRLLIETRVYDALGREWFARERPDLLLVYVQGTDSVGHVFAPYAPPQQPSIGDADYQRYRDVAERYFATVDQMLAAYVQLAESTGSVLMLASDHGFTWDEGRPVALSSAAAATAARWHTDQGMYLLWGDGVDRAGGGRTAGRVDQVCATILAWLSLPPGQGVAGPVLPGAPMTARGAVDYRAAYTRSTRVDVPAEHAATAARADADALERLRALGYIGAREGRGQLFGTRTAGSLNNEGLLRKQRGQITEAIEAFETAIRVDPNLASALWNLSDLYYSRNEQLDASDTLLARAFGHDLPEGRQHLIGRAIAYQRNGRVDRSVALLGQAAAAKPGDPEVWLFRGRFRVERGECAGAVEDFRQAARLAPDNAAVFASMGLAEACAGQPAAARLSFQKSLQLDPNQPKVREYLRGGGS